MSSPLGAAEVKQSKDEQGTLHITNPGKTEPGKPETAQKPAYRPGRYRPQPTPEAAAPPPQAEETPPQTAPAPPQAAAPPPQTTEPSAQEAKSEKPFMIVAPGIAVAPEEGAEESESAPEPVTPSRSSTGRVNVGTGHGGRR